MRLRLPPGTDRCSFERRISSVWCPLVQWVGPSRCTSKDCGLCEGQGCLHTEVCVCGGEGGWRGGRLTKSWNLKWVWVEKSKRITWIHDSVCTLVYIFRYLSLSLSLTPSFPPLISLSLSLSHPPPLLSHLSGLDQKLTQRHSLLQVAPTHRHFEESRQTTPP